MKGLTPGGTLPLGTLEGGKTAIEHGTINVEMVRKSYFFVLFLAKQLISNKKRISFEDAKRLDKSNESMPPWQQLHPSSSGLTSGVASSNSGSSSPRMAGATATSSSVSSSSSPVNTLADASSGVTTNLLMDSTNTNCNGNGNDKPSGRTGNDSSKNPYRTK